MELWMMGLTRCQDANEACLNLNFHVTVHTSGICRHVDSIGELGPTSRQAPAFL
jgi:hypothetical protein